MRALFLGAVFLTFMIITGSVVALPNAYAVTLDIESGINGNDYTVEGTPGTAGVLGVDYALGTYLGGGNGGLGHGFPNAYSFAGGFVAPIPPSGTTPAGAMEATDHNWLQGTTRPIVVDLGAGNAADQAIVFNSIDHTGIGGSFGGDAEMLFWDVFVEGIEFTVYATNDAVDAAACATTDNAFGTAESGTVPPSGTCSTFDQGDLDYVFIDGWADFGNAQEGDDFASVWQFDQPYRYVAVYSHFTDPIIGDGFQSEDNELDAIGRFLKDVGEPCPDCPQVAVGGELLGIDMTSLLVAGIFANSSWLAPTLAGIAAAGLATVVGLRRRHTTN